MTVNVTRDAINVREKLAELDKPTGIAGEAMLRAETPQEQFNLIGAGRRNLIINGDMRIAQRGTSATVSDSSNEGYSTLDRWYLNFNNAIGGAVGFSQSSDAPNGFSKSLKVECSTADTSHTTNQYISVNQRIEAQDLQHLAYGTSSAKTLVLSWRMKSVAYNGPITVALQTSDGTSEYYVKSYTPTTNWAEYICVIPPSTSATINSDSGEGLRISFVLAGDGGSSIAKSSDSTGWSTTRSDYRSDIGNIVSSTSNEIYITGVQLEVGKVATPFEHRSYGEELALCQRYTYVLSQLTDQHNFIGTNYTTTDVYYKVQFPVPMRTAPSEESNNLLVNTYSAGATIASNAAVSVNNTSTLTSQLTNTISGATAGYVSHIDIGSGSIVFKAEL